MSDKPAELQGWKEIASYLGRSMRAAQRWEAQHGLPVRRIGGSVYADRAEIDAWKRTPRGQSAARSVDPPDEADPGPPLDQTMAATAPVAAGPAPPGPRRWWLGPRAAIAAAAVLAVALLGLALGGVDRDAAANWLDGSSAALEAAPEGWDRAGLDPGPWPAVHHDGRQSAQGHTRGPADPAPPLRLLEADDLLSPTQAMVATSDGLIVTGTCGGRLLAARLDGSLAWASALDRQHNPESAVGLAVSRQGQLVVSTGECPHGLFANARTQLHLSRISDGASAFRLRTGAMNTAAAISREHVVYQADQYNTLRALDVLGSVRWTVDLPGFGITPPVQTADGTLLVGTDGWVFGHRSVWAVSASGQVLWNRVEALLVRLAADASGRLYGIDGNFDIGARPRGPARLVSLTPSGEWRWAVAFPSWTHPGNADGLAVGPSGPVVRTDNALVALSPEGAERWRLPVPNARPIATGMLVLDREETAFLSSGDEVVAVDRDGRVRWRVPVPEAGRLILAGEGLLAVASANRRILLVRDRAAASNPTDTPEPQ